MANEPRCPFCGTVLPIPPGSQLQVTCPGCGRFVGAGGGGSAHRVVLLVALGAFLGLGVLGSTAAFLVIRGAQSDRQEAAEAARAEAELAARKAEEEALRREAMEKARARALAEQASSQPEPPAAQPPRADAPVPPPAPAPAPETRPLPTPARVVAPASHEPPEALRVAMKARAMAVSGGFSAAKAVQVLEGAAGLIDRCFVDARTSCGDCTPGFAGMATVWAASTGTVVKVQSLLGHSPGTPNPAAKAAARRLNACLEKDLLSVRYPQGVEMMQAIYRLELRARE